MSTQNPLPGNQPAGDNEKGVTVETVGEAAPTTEPTEQPEETTEATGTSSEQAPEGSDAPGGQPTTETPEAVAAKKEKSDVQKRIDTLTRRRYELEGRNEELEYELARMKRRLAAIEGGDKAGEATQEPAPAATEGKPVRENFTTYEDWVEALTDWKAQKAIKDREAEYQRAQQTTQQNAVVERWNNSLEQARGKYEDFDVVVGSDLKIPQAAFNAIVDSPVGTDIAYFLGSHPEIAKTLAGLSPIGVVRAIGRIEAQFEIPKAQPQPGQTNTTTAGAPGASQPKGTTPARPQATQRPKPITSVASAPVAPVGSRSDRSTKNPDEMSYQEYKRWREEGNGRT